VGVLLYRDNPTKLHQPPPEKGLKMRKKKYVYLGKLTEERREENVSEEKRTRRRKRRGT